MTELSVESGFSTLALSSRLLQQLQRMKISTPTPIQHQAIPLGLEGKDVLGIAQTGTGKTLAFGLPMVQRLDQHPGIALIVLPTRELAAQVDEVLRQIGKAFNLTTALLIGGVSPVGQVRDLAKKPRIIIATPGRLIDFMERKRVPMQQVTMAVLDEADRMFDMGFAPQLQKIMKALPAERQTMLFSATMPAGILKLATTYMKMPVRIEIAPPGSTTTTVEQEMCIIPREAKMSLLQQQLQGGSGPVLVFVRTKFSAKKITQTLRNLGHAVTELHSNRSQGQRRDALAGFKAGKYRVLVATDIAARGIDVQDISLVVNFDLPMNPEDYVHRIGRTGRAGKTGRAISFATPDQRSDIRAIESAIRKPITVKPTDHSTRTTHEHSTPTESKNPQHRDHRPRGPRQNHARGFHAAPKRHVSRQSAGR